MNEKVFTSRKYAEKQAIRNAKIIRIMGIILFAAAVALLAYDIYSKSMEDITFKVILLVGTFLLAFPAPVLLKKIYIPRFGSFSYIITDNSIKDVKRSGKTKEYKFSDIKDITFIDQSPKPSYFDISIKDVTDRPITDEIGQKVDAGHRLIIETTLRKLGYTVNLLLTNEELNEFAKYLREKFVKAGE